MPGYTPPAEVEKPASVALAQKLMYAGAVLVVINLIASFLTIGQLRDQIADTPNMNPDDINIAATVTLIFGTFIGVIYIGLWLLMAWANGKGKNWARITASVFFGISILGLLYILATGLPIAKVIEVISFLVGAATIYLLWAGKGAKEYFQPRM